MSRDRICAPGTQGRGGSSYKSLHGAVESMSVVSAELRVGTLEGRVSRSLRLLNTAVGRCHVNRLSFLSTRPFLPCRIEFDVPVPVSLLVLVVLRRVLGLCEDW